MWNLFDRDGKNCEYLTQSAGIILKEYAENFVSVSFVIVGLHYLEKLFARVL